MQRYSVIEIETFLARIYGSRQLVVTPYVYTTTFAALAQNTTQTSVVNIAANADFCILRLSHRGQIGTAQTVSTQTIPFVRLLIIDSGSNEQYTNQAIDLANYSSSGFSDQVLDYPRLVSGRSALTLQVTNYAPTPETYATLDIALTGVLVRAINPNT
jgi:hypothetical protein